MDEKSTVSLKGIFVKEGTRRLDPNGSWEEWEWDLENKVHYKSTNQNDYVECDCWGRFSIDETVHSNKFKMKFRKKKGNTVVEKEKEIPLPPGQAYRKYDCIEEI